MSLMTATHRNCGDDARPPLVFGSHRAITFSVAGSVHAEATAEDCTREHVGRCRTRRIAPASVRRECGGTTR